jgi:hypothetical protein
MTKMLVALFAVGAAILTVGEFWDGVYKTPILVVGAGLSAIPFVAIGVIGASVMVRSVFNSENCPKISNQEREATESSPRRASGVPAE